MTTLQSRDSQLELPYIIQEEEILKTDAKIVGIRRKISNLFKRTPKKPVEYEPPPHDAEREEAMNQIHILQSKIKASDVPQWLWTRDECRAFLYAFIVSYLQVRRKSIILLSKNLLSNSAFRFKTTTNPKSSRCPPQSPWEKP